VNIPRANVLRARLLVINADARGAFLDEHLANLIVRCVGPLVHDVDACSAELGANPAKPIAFMPGLLTSAFLVSGLDDELVRPEHFGTASGTTAWSDWRSAAAKCRAPPSCCTAFVVEPNVVLPKSSPAKWQYLRIDSKVQRKVILFVRPSARSGRS
jgi:hypothetical protein